MSFSPRLQPEEYLHVIITRFNLGQPSPDWIAPRCPLFERFALPSVRSQTSQQFIWLLLGDAETPVEWRLKLESLLSERMEFVWTTRDRAGLWSRIAELRKTTHTHLLTTRLDTDDAVARDYVTNVQNAARRSGRRYFINLPLGYRWYDGQVTPSRHASNQFISCCEPYDGFATVHCGAKHTRLRQVGPIVQVATPSPAWVYTYHGTNVWNPGQRPTAAAWKDESMISDHFCINHHVVLPPCR